MKLHPNMTPQAIVYYLNKMMKLELYNIGQADRPVFPKGRKQTWRSDNVDKLLEMGLIEVKEYGPPDFKAFKLTALGEEVYPLIVSHAVATIMEFRARSLV